MQVVHQYRPDVPSDRLIRLPIVENLTATKKSRLYALMAQNLFPQPIRLSARHVAWSESAVLQWVQDRIAGKAQTGGGHA